MKLTKRLFTAGVALALTLSLNVPAFAAETGTITLNNATVGQSYAGYKLFDVTYSGENVAYTIDSENQFYNGISEGNNDPFVLTETTVAGVYNVSLAEGKSETDVVNWLNTLEFDGYTADLTETSASTATVEWTNVPYGYYLITSTLGSVVTVDQNTPDVVIIDKNQDGGSDFTKKVNGTDEVVEIGEEFDFTLNFDATNYDGETKITQYTITDTLDNAMDLVYTQGDSTYGVEVQVNGSPVSNATVSLNGKTLKIDIPWTDEDGSSLYTSPSKVTVTYTAKLNGTASIQEDIKNNATLTWDGESTGTFTEETVQTYALAIMKVDNEGNALEGATFAVTKGGNPVNVSAVPGKEGEYVVDPTSSSNTVVSPRSGLIVIKGVDNVKYTLTETDAPAGYNLLVSPVEVTPVKESSTTIIIYKDENGNVTDVVSEDKTEVTSDVKVTAKVVVNQAGTELPSTGGMGTTVLYIAGVALALGAGITLVVRRRMNSDR